MNNPVIIIAIYFMVVLLIGLYSSFKIKNAGDYFIAGKDGNLLQISGSLFATIMGGTAVLGTFELSQKTGWPAIWFLLCASMGLILLSPLAKKVSYYGQYTLPEMLQKFYGKKAEIAASAIIPVAWLGVIGAQIIAAAKILNGMNLMSYPLAALLSGGVFIAYTLIGGQISILKTDALQAILICLGLFILFFKVAGSQKIEFPLLESPRQLFNSRFTFLDLVILFFTYSMTFVVGPDIYSRIFCAKSGRTAITSVILVAVILIPAGYTITYLGISSVHIANDTTTHGIIPLGGSLLPGWAFGLLIAALLSAVMSSADTTLLTASIILTELLTGNLEKKKSLLITRIFILVTGILSILIALKINSIIDSLLFALSFFSGAFVIPILAGLLSLKVNPKMVIPAIICGGLAGLIGKITQVFYAEITGNIIIISAYFINGILLFKPFGPKLTK